MSFSESVQMMESFLKQENWIVQVFVVVFLTAFINWLQKRILTKLINRLKKTGPTGIRPYLSLPKSQ